VAAPSLILAFDIANHALVSFQGSSSTLPQLRQTRYNARIYIVAPSATSNFININYATVDYTQYDGIRMGIWSASTGTTGDSATYLLALTAQADWTLTTDSNGYQCFEGIFNCNTTQMATFLGSASTGTAFLAVNMTKSTDLLEVFDQRSGTKNVTVNSATDEFSGVAISVTGSQSTFTLPCEFYNPVSGHRFAVTEAATSPPTILITCINP